MWRLDPGWNDSDHGSALLRCAGHNVRKPRHAYDFIIDLLPIGLNTLLAVISNYTRLKYFILMGWGEEPKTACIKNTVVIIFKLRGRWWGDLPHVSPTCVRLCNVMYFCFVSIKDKGSRSGQDQTTWTAPMYRFFKLQWVTFSRSSFVYKSYHEIYRIDRRSNVHGNITCWRHSLWSIRSLLLLSLNFQDYINHEFYVSDSFYNDMAIVKIATPGFGYWDDAIRPICLPTKPASEVVGEEGIISGWGTTETGTYTHTHTF